MGGGVVVQPAAATHNCSELESTAVFITGPVGDLLDRTVNNGECTTSHTEGDVQEVRGATTNQSKSDIYNAALSQKASSESYSVLYRNYLNDTESAAWMQAEIAIANAYKNGSSKAVAKSKARAAIADYYTTKQLNLIDNWEASATAFKALRERAENESNISKTYVSLGYDASWGGYLINSVNTTYLGPENVTVTTANGSNTTVEALRFKMRTGKSSEENPPGPVTFHPADDEQTHYSWIGSVDDMDGTHHTVDLTVYGANVSAPNSNYEAATFMNFTEYRQQYKRTQTLNDALQSEVDPFVDSTWEAYQAGTINSSDVLSANTQMFAYGSDYTQDDNLYNAVAALSAMGLATPDLNGTGTMAISYQGGVHHGLVMAREAPNGSWSANTTYNASQIDGPVFIVTTEGEKVDMTGEFSILDISSTDGSTVDSIQATKVVYKTSNTTELQNKIESIEELRKEMEAKEQAAAGGGSGSPVDPKYLLGALAVVGLLAYGKGQQRGD